MKLVLGMKGGRLSLAIELYDVFNFKLLLLDITDSDRLMAEICNNKLSYERAFHQKHPKANDFDCRSWKITS